MAANPDYVPAIDAHLRKLARRVDPSRAGSFGRAAAIANSERAMNSGVPQRALRRLVQEDVSRDLHYPWRVIVCCALLNQTTGAQVRLRVRDVFARCPDPSAMLLADLEDLLRPLGLQNRRAVLLRRLTWDYLSGKRPAECYGVGQYGRDAIALFVDGRKDLKAVADHWLDGYLHMRRWQGVPPPRWDKAGHRRWRWLQGFAT